MRGLGWGRGSTGSSREAWRGGVAEPRESKAPALELREGEAEKGVESTSDPGDGRREGPGIYWGAGGRRKCRWRKEGPYEPGP